MVRVARVALVALMMVGISACGPGPLTRSKARDMLAPLIANGSPLRAKFMLGKTMYPSATECPYAALLREGIVNCEMLGHYFGSDYTWRIVLNDNARGRATPEPGARADWGYYFVDVAKPRLKEITGITTEEGGKRARVEYTVEWAANELGEKLWAEIQAKKVRLDHSPRGLSGSAEVATCQLYDDGWRCGG